MASAASSNSGNDYANLLANAEALRTSGAQWQKSARDGSRQGRMEGREISPDAPKGQSSNCTKNVILVAALLTIFVFAIMSIKGTTSLTTASGVMLGCGVFSAALYLHNNRKDLSVKWKSVVFDIVLLMLPAIVGGSLGLGHVLTSNQMGWIVMGSMIAWTIGLCCRMRDKVPSVAARKMLEDPSLRDFFKNKPKSQEALESLSEATKEMNMQKANLHRATVIAKVILEVIADDKDFTDEVQKNSELQEKFRDLVQTRNYLEILRDPQFQDLSDRVINKYPSIRDANPRAILDLILNLVPHETES